MTRVVVEAPAKVNLGLDVIGRRSDGYHNIRSVMAMLTLADRLEVFEDEAESNGEVDGVRGADNLIRKALARFRLAVPESNGLGWKIEKHVPAAAGLGGASADAAAALLAANWLAGVPLHHDELSGLAQELGSDIAFFLGTPMAIASSRGETLQPLPPASGRLLLIVPPVNLEAKTHSMYAALHPTDYRDGTAADRVASDLAQGVLPTSRTLSNSFTRAAKERVPVIAEIWSVLERESIGPVALSGAGPTTYVLLRPDLEEEPVIRSLKMALPEGVTLIPAAFRGHSMIVATEIDDCYVQR